MAFSLPCLVHTLLLVTGSKMGHFLAGTVFFWGLKQELELRGVKVVLLATTWCETRLLSFTELFLRVMQISKMKPEFGLNDIEDSSSTVKSGRVTPF